MRSDRTDHWVLKICVASSAYRSVTHRCYAKSSLRLLFLFLIEEVVPCSSLILLILLSHQIVIFLHLSIGIKLIILCVLIVKTMRHGVILFLKGFIVIINSVVSVALEWGLSRLIDNVNTVDLFLLIV